MNVRQLTDRIRTHFQRHTEVTCEVADDICSFIDGQMNPHATFRYADGVLHAEVTGNHAATFPVFPVTGYKNDMEALAAATEWANGTGALTWEWLGDTVPKSGPKFDPLDAAGFPVLDGGGYPFMCDAPTCSVKLEDENAHYVPNPAQTTVPLPDLRLCRYHAEMHDPDDLARVVDEPDEKPLNPIAPQVPNDDDLDRHSALWRVVGCMQEAIQQLSDNDYIYADNGESTNIHHEEVDVIVKHLTHGNEWSAIQYSDFMDMEGIGADVCQSCHVPFEADCERMTRDDNDYCLTCWDKDFRS